MGLFLGKKPFVVDERDIKFRSILTTQLSSLPTPPKVFGYGTLFTDWLMLGNGPDDSVEPGFQGAGDCVLAGAAHETMLWNKLAGTPVTFNGKVVISDYSAITGYILDDDSTDQGTDVRTALVYRKNTGIVDASGHRHKIGAFVQLTAGDYNELEQAAFIFEAVGIGIQFPDSAMDQFNNGEIWDVVPGANIEGGHYIPVTGRKSIDDNGVLTWGIRQGMTQKFYETYCDEAWAFITTEELKNGVNRRGLDLTKLQAALSAL